MPVVRVASQAQGRAEARPVPEVRQGDNVLKEEDMHVTIKDDGKVNEFDCEFIGGVFSKNDYDYSTFMYGMTSASYLAEMFLRFAVAVNDKVDEIV